MIQYRLEDVFMDSGVPQVNFVEPSEYIKTKVSLRTPGRGMIVEGPSGIGKTTCIKKILEEEGIVSTCLSARKTKDVEAIDLLLESPDSMGIIIIDDFHLLTDATKQALSDLLKVLADESREDVKLVLIGINKAGECLIQLAPDLNNRIDTIRFAKNPDEKIRELITKGEEALNIKLACKDEIVAGSFGSFHIAQMLSKSVCIAGRVTERQEKESIVNVSFKEVVYSKMQELDRVFSPVTGQFAVGNRNRRSGKLPYLNLLIWLSESENSALQMDDVYLLHPKSKASISQIADKGYISQLIQTNEAISKVLYYEPKAKILAIEDPKFIFYLRNIDWPLFEEKMGFKLNAEGSSYDFALSFSGESRKYAEMLYKELIDAEATVFYDNSDLGDLIGKDLEKALAPIYASDAKFVVVLFDEYYPKKVWTVFETEQYKSRFSEDAIVPIIFDGVTILPTDVLYKRCYLHFDRSGDVDSQVKKIVNALLSKLAKS